VIISTVIFLLIMFSDLSDLRLWAIQGYYTGNHPMVQETPQLLIPVSATSKGNHWSEHLAIHTGLHTKMEITFLRHCAISLPRVLNDIQSSATLLNTSGTIDDLLKHIHLLSKVFTELHAWLQSKIIVLKPNVFWYTETIRKTKHERGKVKNVGEEPC